MSYTDSQPPFTPTYPPPPSYQSDTDAIGVWPQFPGNSGGGGGDQFDQIQNPHQPPYKRPRTSDESNPNYVNNNNLPVNKGITNIFFKTRMCAKFRTGNCRNGELCNFAHGIQDLRQPPPNWQELVGVGPGGGGGGRSEEERQDRQDKGESRAQGSGNWDEDQRIIHKMKLCKKFYNGEDCPYGDRCNFLHEDPARFRDDHAVRYRESSAISIGTTGQHHSTAGHGIGGGGGVGFNVCEANRPVANNAGLDASRMQPKPVYWKTKLCTKWETTGQCPFGEKCHFAHGQADLQVPGGRSEGEPGIVGSMLTKPPPLVSTNASPAMSVNVPSLIEEGQGKKCLLKWKGPKKINRIYGDWLDDLPLAHNLTNQVESLV
ncbi:hypothetical protein Tsubulata_033931 [Turnera subulata]|uniref:C3H1-type domain-containing protein n=1 Tax=Turnera subulata TaxID=218843 RepID=A0A9Q0G2B7_9ROSI|nr:hypothetical protein Tsubulata_033931 [Turnera subulata]